MADELTDEEKQQLIALFADMLNKPDVRLVGICPPVELAPLGDTHYFICAVGKVEDVEVEIHRMLDRKIPHRF